MSTRHPRPSQIFSLICTLFAGEFLFLEFRTEGLFFLRYKLRVSTRIDERVRSPLSEEAIFFFQPEIIPVGTKKNVAGQQLQNAPHALVVCGDLRIIFVVNELVAGVDIRATYDHHVIGLSAFGHPHGPCGAASCMPWGEVPKEFRSGKPYFVAIGQPAGPFWWRKEEITVACKFKNCLATG